MSDSVSYPPIDTTGFATTQGLLDQYRLESGNPMATAQDMFDGVMAGVRIKDSKSRLSTNVTGAWSRTYPAGFWIGEPSINVTPISATAGSGQITWRANKTQSAGQWTVSVQFTMLPVSVSIAVLGTVNLGVSPGTVTFDYSAAEPNAA